MPPRKKLEQLVAGIVRIQYALSSLSGMILLSLSCGRPSTMTWYLWPEKLSVKSLQLFEIGDPTYTNHNVVDDIGMDRDKVGCDNFQPMIINSKYKCGIDRGVN